MKDKVRGPREKREENASETSVRGTSTDSSRKVSSSIE